MNTHMTTIRKLLACALLLAFAILPAAGCGGHDTPVPSDDPAPGGIVDVIPVSPSIPATAVSPAPTEAPTAEPVTLEGRILAGQVYPLAGGGVLGADSGAESVDIDGDGTPERLSVEDRDGGPAFCIDGEPFMDIGTKVSLVSLDGEHMLFLSEKPGEDGYFLFYPDEGGNLFCRLFGIARSGSSDSFVKRGSYEEYVRSGLDIMLHNPMLYTGVDGARRTLKLDMDGDGESEQIAFDSAVLTVNGLENAPILSTTMPRFTFDAEHGAIVLSGSAGDYALSLRFDGSSLNEDISYASLL